MNGHVPIAAQMARAARNIRFLWGVVFASSVFTFWEARFDSFGAPPGPVSPVIGPILFASACMAALFGIFFPRAQLAAVLRRRRPSPALVQTGAIIGLVLTQSVALFGLMVAMFQAPGGHELVLFVLAWVLFAARFPTAARPFGLLGPALDLSEPEAGPLR